MREKRHPIAALSLLRRTGALLALVAFVLAVACGGSSESSTAEPSEVAGGGGGIESVESDDGLLTLSIPEEALPDGVSAADISVTTLSIAEPVGGDDTDDASLVVASFRLEPSGLRFEVPIDVVVMLAVGVVGGPLVAELRSDDGAVELLDVVTADIPGDNDHLAVTTQVQHFSDFSLAYLDVPAGQLLGVEIEAPSTVPVGSSFEVSLTVSRPDDPRDVSARLRVLDPQAESRIP